MNLEKYLNTKQRGASCVMYYVCDEIIKFVDEWYNIACNYHLIDDSKSIEPNLSCFVEHRHDQSIFSLLTKKYNIFSDRVLTDCFISQGSKYKDMYSGKYISNKMKLDCVLK